MGKSLPWLKIGMSEPLNIEKIIESKIPSKPGVYIMLSNDTQYVYPWSKKNGPSKVYYIGKSKDLRRRIIAHKKHYMDIINGDAKYEYYFPIYEYAAYHGCNICWSTVNSEESAIKAEKDLLINFALYYGAKPIANNQSAWLVD